MRYARHSLAIAALLALAGPTRAGVIVVDSTGGGDFTTISAAIGAATNGDTLLIRPGFYTTGVFVDGKSLVIVGDPAGVDIGDGIIVRNVPADGRVVVRGLRSTATGFVLPGLQLSDNAGPVWIENCSVVGGQGQGDHFGCLFGNTLPGGAGLATKNCAAVVVARCQLEGGRGENAHILLSTVFFPTDGGAGARVESSSVAFYDCELLAGDGGSGTVACPGVVPANGGDGCATVGSKVLLSGCGVYGGSPGLGLGGNGLSLDAGSIVHLLDDALVPGPGGSPIANGGGVVDTFSGLTRTFELTSPLREGQPGSLHMQGVQGDFVAFFWSFTAGALPMPARNGWFVLSGPFLAGPFLLGSIAAPSGVWDLPVTGPNLPPASEAMTFLLQAYFAYPGGVTLGSGTAFTLVDAAF